MEIVLQLNKIYIIECSLCNQFYARSTTTTLKQRFFSYFSIIKNYFPFKFSHDSIGRHFNLYNHNFSKHLKIYLFRYDINDKLNLLNVESL